MSELAPIGHNEPPAPTAVQEAAAYSAELAGKIAGAKKRYFAISLPLTDATAPKMRDVMAFFTDLATEAELERRRIQKPSEDALEGIRNQFRGPVDDAGKMKAMARAALNAHLEVERLRIEKEAAEARDRAEELRLRAEKEAQGSAGLFDPFDAAADAAKVAAEAEADAIYAEAQAGNGPRVASASGSARAAGFRTSYEVKVVDAKKLVAAMAKNPEVMEAARKAAAALVRASKGVLAKPIPGIEIKEVRNAV